MTRANVLASVGGRGWLRALFLALPLPLLLAAATPSCGSDGSKNGSSPHQGQGGGNVAPPTSCNGHAELCSRRYDAVAYAGTHGSYADVNEDFQAADQTYPIARQLEDGVRVLHFEIHVDKNDVYACHAYCALGEKLLVDDLTSVATFVSKNPDNVVTLLLERSDNVITADQIGQAFDKSGLSNYLHVQQPTDPWPTLGDMIEQRKQVVALLDITSGSHYDALMPRWNFTWETPWDNEKPSDFGRCNADRGKQGNPIYVVDTYLEDEVLPTATHAELVNYDPFLIDRQLDCKKQTSTAPNFVMVNYYEVSDLFHVVDVLNGFDPTPHDDLSDFPPTAWPDGGTPDGG